MKIGTITNTNKKGQIVIPKKIRDMFSITEDVPLHITAKDGGIYIHPIKDIVPEEDSDQSQNAYLEILKRTQGAWKDEDWDEYDKLEKKRHKLELAATKRNKNAW